MAAETASGTTTPNTDAHTGAGGIKGLVSKLRRHSLNFTPKGSQSDLGSYGNGNSNGSETPRKVNSQRTSTSSRSLVNKSPARDATVSLELWNAAYDALRDQPSTGGLVLAYESIISHELPDHLRTDGMNMSFRGRSDEDRLHLLTAITNAGLNKRRGSKASQSDDLARAVIELSKDAIEPLMARYSSTAVAWGGICTMTPLLLDPILRVEHLRVGILHVLGRVSWYMTLTKVLLIGSYEREENPRLHRQRAREKIFRQYRKVLEFEMNCVCAAASGWNPGAKNVVSWNGLADMVAHIQDGDDELFKAVQNASPNHDLSKYYNDLELPSPSVESSSEIDAGVAPNATTTTTTSAAA